MKGGLQIEERGLQKVMKMAETKAQEVAAKKGKWGCKLRQKEGCKKWRKKAKVGSERGEERAAIKREKRLQIEDGTANRGIRFGEWMFTLIQTLP